MVGAAAVVEVADMIEALKQAPPEETPFGKYEEEAIASLILDHPEFFANITPYLEDKLFSNLEVRFIIANILQYYEKYNTFPTRGMLRDTITRHLTVDDIGVEDILRIVDRKSDPREIPALKDHIVTWAKGKAYELLWSKETIERYNKGDFAYIDEVVEKAQRIKEVGGKSLWFFDELEKIFVDDTSERFTTGIDQLDHYLNDGGPGRKEMLVWMAPTGVGKSIKLANDAIANSRRGKKVLYVTLELSTLLSALRALGALTGQPIDDRKALRDRKTEMLKIAGAFRSAGAGDIVIHEFPPDEVSVDAIYSLVDELKRTKGWVPDIVIVDYLELLVSRREADNADGYTRQKSIATQLRGLAINLNVCVFSATQTNRSGNDAEQIGVTNAAESYGKVMPMDYLISINQTEDEYQEAQANKQGQARLYIAKNRNGPKFQTIVVSINYRTMAIKPLLTG